jgi:GT2 family glycosyltransferase
LPPPRVTVIIPTLLAGKPLARALGCLAQQTYKNFETIVVDNSGTSAAVAFAAPPQVRVLENPENLGFGAAVNRAIESSESELLCTLNDDAYAAPEWLENLVQAADSHPEAGMLASQIRLASHPGQLDSAGLGIYTDGTTKQRGHREPAGNYSREEEVLIPSACAALYRRALLDRVGVFDADYFLYCEDTDLGLRARIAGESCRYIPQAVVEHDYSVSSGRASRLKAYYVERNRLWTVIKTFPVSLWPLVPLYSAWRYTLHLWALVTGRGLAAEFTRGGEKWWRLVLIVGSAHAHALSHLPALLAKRKRIRSGATLDGWAFWKLLRRHYATASQIAIQ